MSLRATFMGWFRYSDTGTPYRAWRFTEDVPDEPIKTGWELHDSGPGFTACRFLVLNGEVDEAGTNDVSTAARWLGAASTDWLEHWPATADSLPELRKLVKRSRDDNASHTLLEKSTRQLLNALTLILQPRIGRAIDGSGATRFGQSNHWLRYVRQDSYSNTESRFVVWELLQDFEPIGGTAGDELWDESHDDDDLTPFRLKREGKQIGAPEWWQVEQLFEGLDRENPDTGTSAHAGRTKPPRPTDPRISAVLPFGTGHTISGKERKDDQVVSPAPAGTAFVAEADIPDTDIRAGDVLLVLHIPRITKAQRRAITGHVHRVSRAQFRAVCAARESLSLAGSSWPGWTEDDQQDRAFDRLRRADAEYQRRGEKSRDTSPLVLLRPWHVITRPIQAVSDDDAIFELLAETGCRPGGAR